MKKVISIGLIALLLMNTMGYYAIFWGFQVHSDLKMADQLDQGVYDESNTITISIPVSIPYMMDQEEFSRADGKFLHEGKYYQMVKQKYANDTLTVVCVRDTDSEHIQTALGDYAKNFADNPEQGKQQSKFSFSIIKDFTVHSPVIVTSVGGWNTEVMAMTDYSFGISTYTASITHPPC